MNQEIQGLSKQQLKSRETRAKIFQAAKRILQKQGYEQLSIKNICEEAGVSNGSFYHHFKTKDDLLSYYIEEQPSMDPNLLDLPSSAAGTKEAIISVYLNYVHYCEELGVEFMANYYTPKNQSLNPLIRTERPYPIITVHDYLKRVIDAGIISPPADLEDITTDIRMIVIGNVFEWCLKSGDADFEGNMRRSLTTYLNGLSMNLQRMNTVCTRLLPIPMPDPAEGFFSGNRLKKFCWKKKSHIMFYLRNISIMLPAWCMI